jgi:hypothetical protein
MGVLLNPPLNCTPSWFALLFSILACGVQLSSSEVESEILKARVFGKSFDTLNIRLGFRNWPYLYKFNSLLSFLLFSMFTVEQLHFLSQY